MIASPRTFENPALRLVLFGQPGAGKSALLEALARAVGGTGDAHAVIDLGGEMLPDLEAVSNAPRQEVRPSLVTYRPEDGPAMNAVLMDSAGTAAKRLLTDALALETSPSGSLADAVGHADALLLLVDAAAAPTALDAEFAAFARFLHTLEEVRGDRAEVGGLPVFLVLTRCDLLARAGDGPADWLERLEQRKRDLDVRFRSALGRAEEGDAEGGFGDIELHLWATAARRPNFGGKTTPKAEPYGVGELFRLCLERAAAYRAARRRSTRRLGWVVAGAITVLSCLLGLTAFSLLTRSHRETTNLLEQQVRLLKAADQPTPAERLKGDDERLRERQATLEKVRQDSGFTGLPSDLREFVEERSWELQSYLDRLDTVLALNPADARSEEGVQENHRELEKLRPGPELAGTQLATLCEQRLAVCDALLQSARTTRGWFERNRGEAADLLSFRGYQDTQWPAWSDRCGEVLDPPGGTGRPRPRDPVPGSPDKTVTLATVLAYPEVADAAARYERTRRQLDRLRQIGIALDLVRAPDRAAALLVFEGTFDLKSSAQRYQQVQDKYPFLIAPDLTLADLEAGEPALRAIQAAAQQQYVQLLKPARQAVLNHLPAPDKVPDDTPRGWESVADWLNRDNHGDDVRQSLNAWNKVAGILVRLQGATRSADPVQELGVFLKQKSFALRMRILELEVPVGIRVKPVDNAELTVSQARSPALVLKWDNKTMASPSGDVNRYQFSLPVGRGDELEYRPGDALEATVRLQIQDEGEGQFTWSRSRTATYQFECLATEPLLDRQRGVRLTVVAPSPDRGGIPRVPDLLPEVPKPKP